MMRAVVALEAAVLGAGVALLAVGPGAGDDGAAVEAPPRVEIPQEAFRIPDRGVLEMKMDLNTVTAEDLDLVPGIGPSMARKIIEEREKNGPFSSFDDVDERVKGVGPSTIMKLAPYVTVGGAATERVGEVEGTAADRPKVNVNTASIEELMTLDGIGKARAERIIEGRPYKTRDDLLNVKGIGHATVERLEPYIEF
jgi:competence protein ComEA